ncbi:MAG: hypothetical protein A3J24_10385 [Deltaproteobacteria bacterium RIFCSPLOWO2_02_FULL_53_8]|nr:MAG: hypothetical protein A3J24_10385 [Deltaproteobacteria bacterium RIFCSPLOWO2_02_FULL_53_8]
MSNHYKNVSHDISRAILAKKPNTLLIFPPEADGVSLLTQIRRIGCIAEICWPPPVYIDKKIDLIFLWMQPVAEPLEYEWLLEGGPPIISVSNFDSPTLIDEAARIGVMNILIAPIRAAGLLSTIVITIHQAEKNSRKSHRIAQLENKILNLKTLEEAKSILIRKQNITEVEVYEMIRSQAMLQRVSVQDIAREIVQSERTLSRIIGVSPKSV